MNRAEIKQDAKHILNSHFSFYFLLFLPVLLIELIGGIVYYWNSSDTPKPSDVYGSLILWMASLLAVGVYFVCVDAFRQKLTYDNPLRKSLTIFNNGDYFLGTLLIGILTGIFTFLWTLLLIVPGIIKSFSYSQSFFIYRDAIDRGERMSYLDAITRSRELMDGHKMDYFVMVLSFIGWDLLVLVTLGIAAIWVQPYMGLSFANFYNELANQHDAAPELIDEKATSDDQADNDVHTNNDDKQ